MDGRSGRRLHNKRRARLENGRLDEIFPKKHKRGGTSRGRFRLESLRLKHPANLHTTGVEGNALQISLVYSLRNPLTP
jgi:hypothetical protein